MVAAAAPASCWYMMERTSAAKPSSNLSRSLTGPAALMTRAIAGSRRATSRAPRSSSAWVGCVSANPARRAPRRGSGEFGDEEVEIVAAHPQVVLAEILQRTLGDVLGGGEVVHGRVHVKEPGHQVAGGASLFYDPHRGVAVERIVVLAQLLEQDVRPIVEFDIADR